MPRIRNYAGRGDAGKPLSHGRPKSTFTSHELKYGLVLALGTLVGASFCAALYSEATTTPEGSMLTPTPVDCSPRVLLHKIFSTSQPDQEIYHDSDLSLIIKPHAADLELKFADGQETTIDLHLETPLASAMTWSTLAREQGIVYLIPHRLPDFQ